MIFIVVAQRNAGKLIERCLDSIVEQTYKDWKVVVVDDMSTDSTVEIASRYADSRIKIVKNTVRKYALRNIVEAIWNHAPHDSIVLTVDGDDALSDPEALQAIQDEYDRTGCDALWTKYEDINGGQCISRPMDGPPLTCGWSMSHLRTFKKHLIWGIDPKIFINPRHKIWWRWTYDQVLYRPILHLAKKPVFFNRVCYKYNSPIVEPDYIDLQIQNGLDIMAILKKEYSYQKSKVTFIVNGPTDKSDRRFHYGEKRAPLGILSMAATLRARGHSIKIVDRFANPGAEFIPAITEADVVGVYCSTPNWHDGKSIISILKGLKKHVIAGGPHAILHPQDVLAAGADCVCVGEADFAIAKIVEDKLTGIIDPGRVNDLNALPFPAFDLLKDGYSWDWTYTDSMPIFSLATSRGCPHFCSFCSSRDLWGREWRGQSADRIMLDINQCQKMGAQGIYFREDNFGHDLNRLKEFAKLNKIEWASEIRADRMLASGLMPLLVQSNCKGIYFGVEHISDRIRLEVFHKGISSREVYDAIKLAQENNIKMSCSFITNHPLESPEEKKEQEDFMKQLENSGETVHRCVWRSKPQ